MPATGPHGDPSSAPPPLSFYRLIADARNSLLCACISAVLSAALSVLPFWLLYQIILLLTPQPDLQALWPLVQWLVAVLVLRWTLMALSHVLAHHGAFAIRHRLQHDMAARLGTVPLSFFSGRGSGSLRRTLSDDVSALEGFFAHLLPDAVAAASVPLLALALLFYADWRLALAALLPLPLALLGQLRLMRRASQRMLQWQALQQRIADQIGEYVRGIPVIKTFGLAAHCFGTLATTVQAGAGWVADFARSSAAGWVVFTALLSANLVLVAPLGAWLLLQAQLALPTYVLFLLVAPVVLQPLLRLNFALSEQAHRRAALGRINALLNAAQLSQPSPVALPTAPLTLEFIDVQHRYGERTALAGVSFKVAAASLTAVVGASGSGKSSLLRLLPRLYDYAAGSVRVGGIELRDWPLDALLAQIAMVFQEVFLFHGSVADNLRLARPEASAAQLEEVARAACAHDFIMALPQGYDTPLGERGVNLSGGQRQRLSIARALLKDAPILLLDEATASIDADNEAAIQQGLTRLCRGRTVLMVAHRLRTVMHADQIIVMAAGRVAGQGRHADLLHHCAAYQQLWHDHESARGWSLGCAHSPSDTPRAIVQLDVRTAL